MKHKKLSGEECGILIAIHCLTNRLYEITTNDVLKQRLNVSLEALPFSQPNGLKKP